jgi:hypothetical protein
MSLNLVSPGVKVREVDLTVGRIDAVNDQVGAIAGPFARGPIGVPVLVETEQDLLNTFGKPQNTDGQYEYWMTASSYLSYGGTLRVIRSDDGNLVNAHAGVAGTVLSLKIKSQEDYANSYSAASDWHYAARESGSWSNKLKICTIDSAADQRVSIGTFGLDVGYGITCGFTTSYADPVDGTVKSFTGFTKGIITQINNGSVDVKILSRTENATGTAVAVEYTESGLNRVQSQIDGEKSTYWQVFNNVGTATSLEKFRITNDVTVSLGSTELLTNNTEVGSRIKAETVTFPGDLVQTLNGTLSARVVGFDTGKIILDTASPAGFAATTLVVRYTRDAVDQTDDNGEGLLPEASYHKVTDWYDEQTLGLENSTVYWKNVAPRPGTSQYSESRNGKNDEMHVVVVDDNGSVSGVSGNILEKFTNLSKATDARITPSENIYYKNYIENNSNYLFAGAVDSLVSPQFTTLTGFTVTSGGSLTWGQEASGTAFGLAGNKTYTLDNGANYGATNGYAPTLASVISSYTVLENPAEYDVNFLIQGPSGGSTLFESQAKANKLIAIANGRKDCVAVISPHRSGVVNVTNPETQTNNITQFYDSITSSSYAVFDSGYKYMFDRFNNQFRYIPLNGDIAGLMARTSINNYPWFSPAGAQRGVINNAIKLAYNPTQAQRDLLYPKRINPVIFSPGSGIILFGDKTGLSYASAFDRINVRRLFLTVEDTIQTAARSQLFEFNDALTRSNFVNIVEPYLRDVKAKRGITDFLVVCDETNNTPDVIDANQFRADIFIKPARSINFIGLTFVANRTGVSFEEVVGTV